MGLSLEGMLVPVRLGWHGILPTALGVGAAYLSDNAMIELGGVLLATSGVECYFNSLRFFLRTRRHIRKHGRFDGGFVRPLIADYCSRQGARTAAAHYGMLPEFKRAMEEYPGTVHFKIVPHL